MTDFTGLRASMVEKQIKARGINNPSLLNAMLEVPRELFVSSSYSDWAYEDKPLPIDEGQSISQPYIVALMIDALAPKTGLGKYLEVGTGSGYSAAVLGKIVEKVFSIERHKYLAQLAQKRMNQLEYRNVDVREGDGTLGLASEAPFDGIAVTAGGPDTPNTLLGQLRVGGYLIMPIGTEMRSQILVRVSRLSEIKFRQENLGPVQFVPLIGIEGWREKSIPDIE